MVKKRFNKSENDASKDSRKQPREPASPPRSTPPGDQPVISHRRIIARMVIVAITMVAARYFFAPQVSTLAKVSEEIDRKAVQVTCSKDYEEEKLKFDECFPKQCARIVMDSVVTRGEAKELLRIAKAGLALGGGSGGASILDLHSGALSKGDKFVNIYSVIDEDNDPFSVEDFKIYKRVRRKIHSAIAEEFGIAKSALFLTKPTFFSRMDARPAMTVHDEYWHPHIDKETYGSFDYTSLLYLTDYDSDFQGGRFVFVDQSTNSTVEPKLGRLSFFTSGSENLHHVEKVSGGVRYAITVSFTCDPAKAIQDPTFQPQKK